MLIGLRAMRMTDLTRYDRYVARCLPLAALLLLVILCRDAYTPGPIRLACAMLGGAFTVWALMTARRIR